MMANTDLVLSDGSKVRVTEKQMAMWGRDESAVKSHIEHVRVMNEEVSKQIAALVEMTSSVPHGYTYVRPSRNGSKRVPTVLHYHNVKAISLTVSVDKVASPDRELSAVCEWLGSAED